MNSKKKILLFSFFLGTIFMIIIFVLLFNWEIRHKVYRTVQYVPEEVIKLAIANDLRINNFQGINNKLSNHLKLVKWHAPGRNLLLQGLLRNILFSIALSRTPHASGKSMCLRCPQLLCRFFFEIPKPLTYFEFKSTGNKPLMGFLPQSASAAACIVILP